MRYGSVEFAYAEPFADALAADSAFSSWVLRRTKLAPVADVAILLHDEMRARRSAKADSWWRSHYTERCRCQGCSGQETDLLAVFDVAGRARVALHVEVKQPADDFPKNKDQAMNYALRAACWVRSPPLAVLPHHAADTLLLYSASRRSDYALNLPKFGAALTFEEVAREFPQATAGSVRPSRS